MADDSEPEVFRFPGGARLAADDEPSAEIEFDTPAATGTQDSPIRPPKIRARIPLPAPAHVGAPTAAFRLTPMTALLLGVGLFLVYQWMTSAAENDPDDDEED